MAYENYTGLLAGKIFQKAKQSRSKEFLLYQITRVCFTVNVFHNPVCGIFSENGYYIQYMILYYNGYIMCRKLFFAGPGE